MYYFLVGGSSVSLLGFQMPDDLNLRFLYVNFVVFPLLHSCCHHQQSLMFLRFHRLYRCMESCLVCDLFKTQPLLYVHKPQFCFSNKISIILTEHRHGCAQQSALFKQLKLLLILIHCSCSAGKVYWVFVL